jgi:HPt (histidine-containing phosphotransfer) domain-containing protein
MMNLNYLKEIAGNDKEFLHEVVESFLLQIPQFCNNMKNYDHSCQYDLLSKEAHTAKSSAVLFGLDDLTCLLKELQESAGKQEMVEAYAELIDRIEECFYASAEEMKKMTNSLL